MKDNYDKHRDLWGPLFTLQLQQWGETVFARASILLENNQLQLQEFGQPPRPPVSSKGGNEFSVKGIRTHWLQKLPEEYYRVKYFDYAAAEYEMATRPFKEHIVRQAFKLMQPYIRPNSRILEIGCGPGYESIALSMMVPDAEVIATDLSKEMIRMAAHNAKLMEIRNIGFYQADASDIPASLKGKFDIVYCQLNCSYFRDLSAVAGSIYQALYPSGYVFLAEPYPNIGNSLSIRSAMAANPYFGKLFSKEDLQSVFMNAGFSGFYWKEILPGIALSIITKHKADA